MKMRAIWRTVLFPMMISFFFSIPDYLFAKETVRRNADLSSFTDQEKDQTHLIPPIEIEQGQAARSEQSSLECSHGNNRNYSDYKKGFTRGLNCSRQGSCKEEIRLQ